LIAIAAPRHASAADLFDGPWEGDVSCDSDRGNSYWGDLKLDISGSDVEIVNWPGSDGQELIEQSGYISSTGRIRFAGVAGDEGPHVTSRDDFTMSGVFKNGKIKLAGSGGIAYTCEGHIAPKKPMSAGAIQTVHEAQLERKALDLASLELSKKEAESSLRSLIKKGANIDVNRTGTRKPNAPSVQRKGSSVDTQRPNEQAQQIAVLERKRIANEAHLKKLKKVAEEQALQLAEAQRQREVDTQRLVEFKRQQKEEVRAAEALKQNQAKLKQEQKAQNTRGLAALELQRQEEAQRNKFANINFGKYHALIIGNNEYKHLKKLKTANADATAIASLLRESYGYKVQHLANATRSEIFDALDEYRETLTENDNLLIYYAGHGWLDEAGEQGYWLPVNAKPNRRNNWISNASITSTIKALEAKHVMVVADSCYSGTLTRGVKIRESSPDYVSQMAEKRARLVLTSGGVEPVADNGGSGHSPFASVFLDVLKENKSVIDGTQLFTKMRRPVMLIADQTPEYSDVRKAGHEGGDFLFVRRK